MTDREILDYLDQCEMPMLDNGYYYHADQQISIYRSEKEWVMIIQILQFYNRCPDIKGISTTIYKYGSSVAKGETFNNGSFNFLASDHKAKTYIEGDDSYEYFLNPKVNSIKFNNHLIPIEHDRRKYKLKGIDLESEDTIQPYELLRYISIDYANLFWIDSTELSINFHYNEEIKFTKWEHPDNIETNFSDKKSFIEIANSLANNTNFDRLKIENENSNTHWSNWPIGGTL